MDTAQYQRWWSLHLRVASGERLGEADQSFYDAQVDALDAAERLEGDAARLRQAREAAAAAEEACAALRHRRDDLDAQIAALEAELTERSRQVLGLAE